MSGGTAMTLQNSPDVPRTESSFYGSVDAVHLVSGAAFAKQDVRDEVSGFVACVQSVLARVIHVGDGVGTNER